jgi:hypothetical protein
MLILIVILLAFLVAAVSILLFIALKAVKMAQNTVKTFREFVSPIDDKTPSPLSQFIALESKQIAQDFMMQAKTTMMGKASGDARAESAITGDIIQDVVSSQNPLIGILLDQFPTLKKRIAKNPQMAFGAMNLLSSLGKGSGNNGHSESSVNSDSYKESK